MKLPSEIQAEHQKKRKKVQFVSLVLFDKTSEIAIMTTF